MTSSGQNRNYTYDAAGNVTNDGAHSYEYDAENRLTRVDGGVTAVYMYDYANRRIKKVSGSVNTNYVWEGSQVISEHEGAAGAVIASYVYAGGQVISKVAGDAVRYLLSDRLSVRLTLDSNGNVIGRQGHLPFGEEIGVSWDQDKRRFTTYERDSESGTDYAVNRGYSPTVGRFQQADPYRASGYMVDPQSWNRYAYVQNDPINNVDPLGLDIIPISGGGIAVWQCHGERCWWDIWLVKPTTFAPVPCTNAQAMIDNLRDQLKRVEEFSRDIIGSLTDLVTSGSGNDVEPEGGMLIEELSTLIFRHVYNRDLFPTDNSVIRDRFVQITNKLSAYLKARSSPPVMLPPSKQGIIGNIQETGREGVEQFKSISNQVRSISQCSLSSNQRNQMRDYLQKFGVYSGTFLRVFNAMKNINSPWAPIA